ncbi:MAG: DEAD/DEAH box helicase [Candidatus Kariarchaeaceae archaeon]
MQEETFEPIWLGNENIILAAPTNSGKTAIAEMSILKALLFDKKAIYLSPLRSLGYEKEDDWKTTFGSYGWKAEAVTGETDYSYQKLQRADIILTTVEKLDSLSRKQQGDDLLEEVGVVIVDEIHLLNDPERGGTLEALLMRLKTFSQNSSLRIIGLSATLPNCEEVGEWLDAKTLRYDDSYRMVRLITEIKKYKPLASSFKDRFRKNFIVFNLIKNNISRGFGSLCFVSSRQDTQLLAEKIVDLIIENGIRITTKPDKHILDSVRNPKLQYVMSHSVAFHHANVSRDDRELVERSFREGKLSTLCSTSTLAWGINLPARTVVIRDTSIYNPYKGEQPIGILNILQMQGRAGRAGYDTIGYAYLIVKEDEKNQYEQLIAHGTPIESWLDRSLEDRLNAEIVSNKLKSYLEISEWLKSSFFMVRAQKNSQEKDSSRSPPYPLDLIEVMNEALRGLIEHNFIVPSGPDYVPTELARASAIYYIKTKTISHFNEMIQKIEEGLFPLRKRTILIILSGAAEFKEIPYRKKEKTVLRRYLADISRAHTRGFSPGQEKCLALLIAHFTKPKPKLKFEISRESFVLRKENQRLLQAFISLINSIKASKDIISLSKEVYQELGGY